MDAATLADVMANSMPLDYYRHELPMYERAALQCGCTTVNRAAMFAAQVGHEAVGLKYMREIADGTAYEGRADLGNVFPGDGPRYRGRGPVQLTGRSNYTRCSMWAYSKGLVPAPHFFVDHPEKLELDQYKWLGTVWYWTVARPELNSLADSRDLEGATRAINGGLNGFEDRQWRYRRALGFGARILPAGAAIVGGVSELPKGRDMKLLVVDQAECKRKRKAWPGYFADFGYGQPLVHIKSGADLRALRVSGWPAPKKISIWTYKQRGGM